MRDLDHTRVKRRIFSTIFVSHYSSLKTKMYNKIKSIVGGCLIATITMFIMVEGTDKAIVEDEAKK